MTNQIQALSQKLDNLFTCKKEREELVKQYGMQSVWGKQLAELHMMIADCKSEIKAVIKASKAQATEINVYFEEGYRWSVDINGGESVDTGLTKAEAMTLAKSLKKQYDNAVINEQRLTKAERKQNISNLHENGYSYTRF